jgi:hypothetical protein
MDGKGNVIGKEAIGLRLSYNDEVFVGTNQMPVSDCPIASEVLIWP